MHYQKLEDHHGYLANFWKAMEIKRQKWQRNSQNLHHILTLHTLQTFVHQDQHLTLAQQVH